MRLTRCVIITATAAGLLVTTVSATAAIAADAAILGSYRNPEGKRAVRVYKEAGYYLGKIVSETADVMPEKSRMDMMVLSRFLFDPDGGKYVDNRLLSPTADAGNYAG